MGVLDKKTDIGKFRECNEDAVALLCHPKNKNIILLAVADGMGGKAFGDIASNYTIDRINDSDKVIDLVERLIKSINTSLIKKYGSDIMGTTLSLAIVNKNNTIIFNIGDSRCYAYKDSKLIQLTEDDSDVWLYHKLFGVRKDHLRYIASSNVINACIGISSDLCNVSVLIISNNYDGLLLFSDGVTDLLTDRKILNIIKKNKEEDILDKIIDNAVNVDQKLSIPLLLRLRVKEKLVIPVVGRDNASGVIYMK